MDSDIVEKIRSRVRKLSSSQTASSNFTPRQLQLIVNLQAFWKMTLLKRKYTKKLKRKEKRKFIIMELQKTEKDYIDDTKIVLQYVMHQVKDFLDQEMFKMLFINLDEIVSIHEDFYRKLAQAVDSYNHNTTKISELILYLTPRLKQPYYTFCLQYSKSHQILRLLNMSNSQFRNHILNLRKQGILKAELSSYLIKPVQRICKYSLLLRQLIKYTDEDHPDFYELQKANDCIKSIVQQTNDKIQQFLCQSRMSQLSNIFPKLQEDSNRFIFQGRANLIDKQKGEQCQCDIYIFTKFIILAQDKKEIQRLPLDQNSNVKDAPTGKYFKNIIIINSKKKVLTLACQNTLKKNQLLEALRKTFSLTQNYDQNRVDVDIEGAEERDSLFSKHTVYIVKIKTREIDIKIFPRFSQLIEIQNQIRKEIPHIEMPHLQKNGWISTRKTKTIEKRMFIIKDFLLNILNDPKVRNVASVFTKLGLQLLVETSLRKKSDSDGNTISVSVNIAGWQQLNVWISEKSKISDLKRKIVGLLSLEHPQEYEIFQCKDKMRKLIYQDQMVSKLSKDGGGFFSKMFSDQSTLIFQRYFYLSDEQEQELYKKDPVRATLQLFIIKSHIQELKLDNELLLTVLAFFAKHLSVQISIDQKIKNFLSSFKHSNLDHIIFRQYCYQIEEVVKRQLTPVPLIIIKILNQAQLYKASQYIVEAYPKTLKQVRKQILLQENMILAIKRNKILFLSSQRHTIYVLQYESIKQLLVYPTSIIFLVQKVKSEIRFNTVQSYQISRLINLYSKNSMQTKHFNYRTSVQ